MKRQILGFLLVSTLMFLLAGSVLAAGQNPPASDEGVPGQLYFTLVGTILSEDIDIISVEAVEVLLHNGNRFVKPVEPGDVQVVLTNSKTVFNTIGLEQEETVSIHGTVEPADTDGDVDVFIAERVTVGVPCPACPDLPVD